MKRNFRENKIVPTDVVASWISLKCFYVGLHIDIAPPKWLEWVLDLLNAYENSVQKEVLALTYSWDSSEGVSKKIFMENVT